MTVQDRIEELRYLLSGRAPAGFHVTARRTQYAFDEHTEAFCEIAVSDDSGDFRLVVVAANESRAVEELMRNVWLRFARELWFVGVDGIRRTTPDSPETVHVVNIDAATMQMYR